MPVRFWQIYGASARLHRERKGWTQQQVAQWLGFADKASVSQIETGTVVPTAEKMVELARLFGTSVSEMIGDLPPARKENEEEAEIRLSLSAILMMLPRHQDRRDIVAHVLAEVSKRLRGEASALLTYTDDGSGDT